MFFPSQAILYIEDMPLATRLRVRLGLLSTRKKAIVTVVQGMRVSSRGYQSYKHERWEKLPNGRITRTDIATSDNISPVPGNVIRVHNGAARR